MKILISGDYCPHDRVADAFNREDFASVFCEIRDVFSKVDYSIINLECPVLTSPAEPIEKLGVNLCCGRQGIDALSWLGVNCVTLANNHSLDYGTRGIKETTDILNEKGIDYVGAGMNSREAARILYVEIDEKTLALVNCCEHEFTIATDTSAGSNPLNPILQYNAITEAKSHADYVIVIVHGGIEHFQLPSTRMVETYRFFIDAGADAVVNHHQHCYSGYEVYKEKPIFYGLGNFCFDWDGKRNSIWNEGYLVELDLIDNNIEFNIYPIIQCSETPSVEIRGELNNKQFRDRINELNTIISKPDLLKKKNEEWMDKDYKSQRNVFMPYTNRLLASACYRGFISDMLTREKLLVFLNKIKCESHKDRLIYFIEKELERLNK